MHAMLLVLQSEIATIRRAWLALPSSWMVSIEKAWKSLFLLDADPPYSNILVLNKERRDGLALVL